MLSSIHEQFDLPTNRLYDLLKKKRGDGRPIIDLVSGNVNAQGIFFPQRLLGTAIRAGLAAAKSYRPHPLGQLKSRQALSRWYAEQGLEISPEQLVIMPGTSLSYWYAFKLLANPGDEILCPTPSYALFDTIASLGGITLSTYRLREDKEWSIDFDQLEQAITPRTRAIVLISPHNPTGAVASEDDIRQLAQIAAAKKMAIISDEVFSPFLFGLTRLPRPAGTQAPLVITLNGFSKMLALPGMKIGWMAITGEKSLVQNSLQTLEMIADTFLPVNEAAQFAVPYLLKNARAFQKEYAAVIGKRMKTAVDFIQGQKAVSFVQPAGGFFLTLKLEGQSMNEEEIACRLLEKHRILVHPGYFYDMEGQHLILSIVNRNPVLRTSLSAILRELNG